MRLRSCRETHAKLVVQSGCSFFDLSVSDLSLLKQCSKLASLTLSGVELNAYAALRFLPALRSFAAMDPLCTLPYLGRLPLLEELMLSRPPSTRTQKATRELAAAWAATWTEDFPKLRMLGAEVLGAVKRLATPGLVVYVHRPKRRVRQEAGFHVESEGANHRECVIAHFGGRVRVSHCEDDNEKSVSFTRSRFGQFASSRPPSRRGFATLALKLRVTQKQLHDFSDCKGVCPLVRASIECGSGIAH